MESLEEARLLLALDFAGAVTEAICQPFRLRFATEDGPVEHIPDVLAVAGDGTWLIDVRPSDRIGEADRVKFAASAEAALACGWRYLVVSGWMPYVTATLDTLSSQRRPLADPLGLRSALLDRASQGPRSFADLVAGTIAPLVARAQLLHLLWHRKLSIDLALPLADATVVRLPDGGRDDGACAGPGGGLWSCPGRGGVDRRAAGAPVRHRRAHPRERRADAGERPFPRRRSAVPAVIAVRRRGGGPGPSAQDTAGSVTAPA